MKTISEDKLDKFATGFSAANPSDTYFMALEIKQLREDLATRYWEGIRNENIDLKKKLKEALTNLAEREAQVERVRKAAEHGEEVLRILVKAQERERGRGEAMPLYLRALGHIRAVLDDTTPPDALREFGEEIAHEAQRALTAGTGPHGIPIMISEESPREVVARVLGEKA